MAKTPNLTPEQKQKNQKFILDNLNKYILDSRGNFIHVDFTLDCENEEEEKCAFIGKEAVSDWEEIMERIASMILQNKEGWEVVLDETGYHIKNRRNGRIIYERGFGLDRGYELVGELGYRKGAWKNYEEEIKLKKKWKEFMRRKKELGSPSNHSNQNNSEENKFENQHFPALPKSDQERETNNSNQITPPPHQDEPAPNTLSNSPPPPADIQNSYNSDQAKTEIDNNPVTTPEQKEQTNEFLKLIIAAELLVKKKKLNQAILSRLSKEKEQNTSLYQFLNKKGRVDKVINELEDLKKSQECNNSTDKNNKQRPASWPTKLLVGEGITTLIIIFAFLISKLKKRKK